MKKKALLMIITLTLVFTLVGCSRIPMLLTDIAKEVQADGGGSAPSGKEDKGISGSGKSEDGWEADEPAEDGPKSGGEEKEEGAGSGDAGRIDLSEVGPNDRIYQNADGYVRVVFEDGKYYQFYDYPNEWDDGYFWNCDWSFWELEGEEQNKEFSTSYSQEKGYSHRTIHATHELMYPMDYYENGNGPMDSYIFLDVNDDTFTITYVDGYNADEDHLCYRINSFTYYRVLVSKQ